MNEPWQVMLVEILRQVRPESTRMRVSPECVATIIFDGPVTKRAIGKLIAQLEVSADLYPDEATGHPEDDQ